MAITQRVTDLVIDLIVQGYKGEASFSTGDYSGAKELLGGKHAIRLTGFCKESLYIYEDADGTIVFVGRYSNEFAGKNPSVGDIVDVAWSMYRRYKDRGYSMPAQFLELFENSGRIRKRVRTVEDWEEL